MAERIVEKKRNWREGFGGPLFGGAKTDATGNKGPVSGGFFSRPMQPEPAKEARSPADFLTSLRSDSPGQRISTLKEMNKILSQPAPGSPLKGNTELARAVADSLHIGITSNNLELSKQSSLLLNSLGSKNASQFTATLMKAAEHENPMVAGNAAIMLRELAQAGKLDPQFADRVRKAMFHSDSDVAGQLATTLGHIGGEEMLPQLEAGKVFWESRSKTATNEVDKFYSGITALQFEKAMEILRSRNRGR